MTCKELNKTLSKFYSMITKRIHKGSFWLSYCKMFVQLLKLFFREHSFTMRSEQSMNNPLFIVIKHIVLSIHQIISSLVLRILNLIIQNPLLFRTCFDQVLWEVLSYSCVPYLGPLCACLEVCNLCHQGFLEILKRMLQNF